MSELTIKTATKILISNMVWLLHVLIHWAQIFTLGSETPVQVEL